MSAERAAEWARHAREELTRRGHRSGGARDAVIAGLAAHDGCCTAAELALQLRGDGRRAGTASVYRALGVLQEAGLVRVLELGEGERRYELVHADGEHHHHVVCDGCGSTLAFHDDELERAIAMAAGRCAWAIGAHDVVLHGT
ncbi:MAG: transcriptional repressor, partial [Actinobacteria bacterium]|nr:transcriptional repressor [Actinomycetota bacterium]